MVVSALSVAGSVVGGIYALSQGHVLLGILSIVLGMPYNVAMFTVFMYVWEQTR